MKTYFHQDHPLQFTLWLKMSDSDYTVNVQVSVHTFRDKIPGFLFGYNFSVKCQLFINIIAFPYIYL